MNLLKKYLSTSVLLCSLSFPVLTPAADVAEVNATEASFQRALQALQIDLRQFVTKDSSPTRIHTTFFVGKNAKNGPCLVRATFSDFSLPDQVEDSLEVAVENGYEKGVIFSPFMTTAVTPNITQIDTAERFHLSNKYQTYPSSHGLEAAWAAAMLTGGLSAAKIERNQVMEIQRKDGKPDSIELQAFTSGLLARPRTLTVSRCTQLHEFTSADWESKVWQQGWPTRGSNSVEVIEGELSRYLEAKKRAN